MAAFYGYCADRYETKLIIPALDVIIMQFRVDRGERY